MFPSSQKLLLLQRKKSDVFTAKVKTVRLGGKSDNICVAYIMRRGCNGMGRNMARANKARNIPALLSTNKKKTENGADE